MRAHIDACKEWPRGDVPRSFIDPVKSELPVMMFSGQADGSASPEYGAEEVKYLPNGRQILVRYYGHQIDSPCEWQIMRDFIARGSVQEVDTSCTEQIRRPPFSLEMPAQYPLLPGGLPKDQAPRSPQPLPADVRNHGPIAFFAVLGTDILMRNSSLGSGYMLVRRATVDWRCGPALQISAGKNKNCS